MSDPGTVPGSAPSLDRAAVAVLLRHDPAVAAARILRAARAGDVGAQALYARMRCEGRGVARNQVDGLYWYTVAANCGHAVAMNMVGRCHELGRGTPASCELAAVWYRKAAAHGLDWGMYNYANLLATGRGVARDQALALVLYRRAAERGHAKSMNLVGRYHEEGVEVGRDPAAAFDWYRKSAHAGDFRGQASYAAVLAQQGRVDEAAHWLQRALLTGTPAFLERLGDELAASPHASIRVIGAQMRERAARPAA